MISSELERLRKLEVRIREIAEEMGLMTKDIIFEIVPAQRVLEGLSYRFPVNFSHWSFGRDYEKNRTIYEHTGHGIPYEQVWNFDVPKAFLVETNPFALNVMTMAHVFGHVDFFLANRYTQLGRSIGDIAEESRLAATRFQKYEARYGIDAVENVIDAAMAIEWHQDPDPFAEEIPEEEIRDHLLAVERVKLERAKTVQGQFKKPSTPEEVKEIEKHLERLMAKTPPQPEYDLLRYIRDHSPKGLKPWEKDILSVVRNQARSLAPNGRTKLLNEGWATYVHVHIMRRLFKEGLLNNRDHGVFNQFHSGVLRENKKGIAWYRIGYAFYEYIKEQWDKGRHGREFQECDDLYKRSHWDTGANEGDSKILEVRARFSDRMAVERFFTDEFMSEQKLYIYQEQTDPQTGEIVDVIVETRPKIIRPQLKRFFTLYGTPVVHVENGNYKDNRELYLVHTFSGFELDPKYDEATLRWIHSLWGHAVHIETFEIEESKKEGEPPEIFSVLDSFDGKRFTSQRMNKKS